MSNSGQCIAVVSGKGGTGKTSLVSCAGSALALAGRRVLCLDCDVGLRNLDLALGLTDQAMMDFSDVAQGRCSLESAAVEHPKVPGLFLLTAPVRSRRSVTPEEMKALLADVRCQFDYCLLDAPAGLGSGFQLAAGGADRCVVVTTADASSLRDAQHTVMELSRFPAGELHLVVNRVRQKMLRQLHATIDDAIDVMEEEATEDFELMAGMSPSDKPYLRTGVVETVKSRIPWLLLLMLSATFTGIVIASFEDKLAVCSVLIGFIPMLMGTGGNCGNQSSVAVIRGLSLDEIDFDDIFRVAWKEARVAVVCGGLLSGANFVKLILVDRWLMGNSEVTVMVALAICLTLVCTVFCAKVVGAMLPLLAERVGLDPAVLAAPFISTIVDVLSLLIYFRFASLLLGL